MEIVRNKRMEAKIKFSNNAFALFMILASVFVGACNQQPKEVKIEADTMHDAMQKLSDVIVHDIFSPPVASRIYAYPSIAAYEIEASQHPKYKSLAGQLHDLKPIPKGGEGVNYDMAAIESFLQVGKNLIFSEEKVQAFIDDWHKKLKEEGMSDDEMEASIAYANKVTKHIMDWANTDNYKETRTFEKFTVNTEDSTRWQPTPPAYIEAIEPHWDEIRPFVIDSADQFVPVRPTTFSSVKGSDFYNDMKKVYETGVNLTEDQADIARFWDCNPYVMNVHGHVMFATKKITPGGHWIGIVKLACMKDSADLMKTAQAYALTSITLNDAFIACWDEKYRSNLIRPETVINKYMDEEWQPLLQTPPFPEYTSGHSVISSAAALSLTSIFGEPFHMIDSTENKYGLPPREYNSFVEASEEAAISRLYGGIHYMPAIAEGVKQGREVGKFILSRIETNPEDRFDISQSKDLANSKYN